MRSSTTMLATRASLIWCGDLRRRRAGVAEPALGRGGRPDHDRLRRAAFLRRVQRRSEARRTRSGRPGHHTHPARRAAHRQREAPPGRCAKAIRSTTTCERSPSAPAWTSRSTSSSTATSASSRRSAATCCHARGGSGRRPRRVDVPGRRLVRRGRDDQCRLSAGPEPLSGRQGNVRGGDRREAGRAHHLRGRVRGRLPRPRLVPRGAGAEPRRSGCSRRSPRAPTTVPDQWQVQVLARVLRSRAGRRVHRRA